MNKNLLKEGLYKNTLQIIQILLVHQSQKIATPNKKALQSIFYILGQTNLCKTPCLFGPVHQVWKVTTTTLEEKPKPILQHLDKPINNKLALQLQKSLSISFCLDKKMWHLVLDTKADVSCYW